MKISPRNGCIIISVAVCLILITVSCAIDGNVINEIGKSFGASGQGLTQDKIAGGLREALRIGAGNAVEKVSITDGYLKNMEIHIPLPEKILKVEKTLRTVGLGTQVDTFEESMNRAAEKAAPAAKSLFVDAVKAMTFDDAKRILKGEDNEATMYLKEKTWSKLLVTFKPMVHQAMANVGVTRQYQELETRFKAVPLVGTGLDLDIDQYVTEKALNGLFVMLEKEEQKIRKDPAARVTELLKEVFGSNV